MTDKPTVVRTGTVTFRAGEIFVHDDWEFAGCSCRDAARLAAIHCLLELSEGLRNDFMVDRPSICMGNP